MRADPEDVVAFVEVATRGSFSAAARALGVQKSNISRRVKKLESTLATQLLRRTTRTLTLTDAGRGYYERSRLALEELEGAERVLEGMQDEPRGLMKVSVPNDSGPMVSELVNEYLGRYPEVRIVVHVSNAQTDLVAEGFDLALRAGQLRDSTLIAKKLASTTMQMAASPDYLKRHGTPRRLLDLSAHHCLVFGSSGVKNTWRLTGPEGIEEVRISGILASNDLSFLHQAALKGWGIARLPKSQLKADLQRGALSSVLSGYCSPSPALYAVYPSASRLSPKVQRFVELCAERVPSYFA